ncbi:hypothetical protein [Chryseobacterium sp. Leaf201]|uniref:hypothetical protein n=1 Tax=Chryseobacterium sp. Leaf201 TaxID=1735672 RepID=UPI0006F86947|nr:hypothetical protein [Chryseobacterium sp. Leaf201]KQM19843.1 hypothetical protein ASE55_18650 [Chryseobacterium sp. Leaf201]
MIKNTLIFSTLLIAILGFSQSKSAPTLKEIQRSLKKGKYSSAILNDFRKQMNYEGYGEYIIDEEIPGEIISFSQQPLVGVSSSRSTSMFIIKNNKLQPLHYLPVHEDYEIDKNFNARVKKYAGEDWSFSYNAEYNISKNINNSYIISTFIKKRADADCCSSLYLEYLTKDFKNFLPYRISEDGKDWDVIK